MSSTLLTSSDNSHLDLQTMFANAYTRQSHEWNARLGFAYASSSGLEALSDAATRIPAWNETAKKWIVGIDGGITEPAAIRQIHALPNSEVRIFTDSHQISKKSLRSYPKFHAKVICIDAGNNQTTCLCVGSANLTWSAMSETPRNYEASMALFGDGISNNAKAGFSQWWSNAWNHSISYSDQIIDRYASLRQDYLQRNPDVKTRLEPPAPAKMAMASSLWIEAGAMSGGSRNQVEFSREVVSYFGQAVETRRFPIIVFRDETWTNRPLSYKITTFGVEIWRFSLPTFKQSGINYPGRVIRFKRLPREGGDAFELEVADLESTKDRRWRNAANRHGYVGLTSGEREYGFY